MALSISMTEALGRLIKPGMRIASLGYPDLIAPLSMIERITGDRFSEIEYRKDSEAICKRHGLEQRQIPDAESLFSLLGCDLTVYDIVRDRGCEVLCDLNYRMPSHLNAFGYDIVLDVGTLEHCFNIAQAAFNMANMVKHRGHAIHENPFNCGNHGLYGLNPTWYHDFYGANGFKVLECRLSMSNRGSPVPLTKRFRFTEEETNIFTVARRDEVMTLSYPVQSKYAKQIPVAGVRAETKEVSNG